jgi:GntR family transcriptional regulator, transcriptional repressor for pyruvate dehydrogenase complex
LFQKITQGRMYQKIVDQVFESIISGELKVNEKLPSEKELGKIFGVSRVTVREAIRSLEQSGVIEVRQGSSGGAYVKEINLDSIAGQMKNPLKMANLNLYQLTAARAFLEEMILMKFESWDKDKKQISELQNSVDEAEIYFKEGQTHKRFDANADFHRIIAQMTGNPIIILMHKLITDLLVEFYERAQPSDSLTVKTFKEHRDIIKLLKEGKYQKAAQICSRHLTDGCLMVAKKYRSQSIFGRDST